MAGNDATQFFWDVAIPFLADERVSKGTMMGFPCLRLDGSFFASAHHRTGDLVVKLPAARVNALITAAEGVPFAPNGRRFREWVLVSTRDEKQWATLIGEAKEFVAAAA